MSRYLKQYKWHIGIFLISILVAIVSNKIINIEDFRFQISDLKNTNSEINKTNTNSKILSADWRTKSEIPNDNISDTTITVNGEKYTSNLANTTTLYQLMQNLSASSIKPFSFQTKEYAGMGHFVEEINGLKNNPQENKYWIYYINGESAKIGISNYFINEGDVIEWKYENAKL